jgi:hypothetical protein
MTCMLSIGRTRAEVLGKGKLGAAEPSGPSPNDGSRHDGCWPTETEPEHAKRTTAIRALSFLLSSALIVSRGS